MPRAAVALTEEQERFVGDGQMTRAILRGGRAHIARSKPDILFEYNPFAMEVRGLAPGEVPALLAGLGVAAFRLCASDGTFLETTGAPERIWAVFQSLGQPVDHLDIHATAQC